MPLRMRNHVTQGRLIMEGLRRAPFEADDEFEELRDEYPAYELEEYNENILNEEAEDEFEPIDEASLVTFGGDPRPKFGWGIVMAGGSGSGKGYVQGHNMDIECKVIDVDELKKLYVAATQHGKFNDTREYDFKNPQDVADLHQIVKQHGFKDKREAAFFANLDPKRLPNVLYDITGDDAKKVDGIGRKLKEAGYKTCLVWVVTNREVAFIQNLMRSRVVPDAIFHDTHNRVPDQIKKLLQGYEGLDYDEKEIIKVSGRWFDEAWIVLGQANPEQMGMKLDREQARMLRKKAVFKLTKLPNGNFAFETERNLGGDGEIKKAYFKDHPEMYEYLTQDLNALIDTTLGPIEDPKGDLANPKTYLSQAEYKEKYGDSLRARDRKALSKSRALRAPNEGRRFIRNGRVMIRA